MSRFNGYSWTGWTGGCQVNPPLNYKDVVLGECGWNFGFSLCNVYDSIGGVDGIGA